LDEGVKMTTELALPDDQSATDGWFQKAFASTKVWCEENQWAIGLGEMAVGAGLVAWGVKNGVIEMGAQLLGTQPAGLTFATKGLVTGVGLGALAGHILGGIGVAAMGTAIGIPALLVAGGSAAVFGLAGYNIGQFFDVQFPPSIGVVELAATGGLLVVGVALLVGGARRLIADSKVAVAMSYVKEKTLVLSELAAPVVARTKEELNGFYEELMTWPKTPTQAALGVSSAALAGWGGAAVGGAVAASSVTFLGSSALGGVALSLGLVSAPIWPVIAGVAGGAGLGYAAYKAVKYWVQKGDPEQE
jgi:uncharacterized membrane protein YebE (DUF533 family)